MKTTSEPHLIEQKRFLRVLAALTGFAGLSLISVAVYLWQWLHSSWVSLLALICGCLALLMAVYSWRVEFNFHQKSRSLALWLASAYLMGIVLFCLFTKPAISTLPIYHPKLFACVAMSVTAAIFARKAWSGRA